MLDTSDATVVDDAIRFVSDNSKDKEKEQVKSLKD
jgi:hypothetical protein